MHHVGIHFNKRCTLNVNSQVNEKLFYLLFTHSEASRNIRKRPRLVIEINGLAKWTGHEQSKGFVLTEVATFRLQKSLSISRHRGLEYVKQYQNISMP